MDPRHETHQLQRSSLDQLLYPLFIHSMDGTVSPHETSTDKSTNPKHTYPRALRRTPPRRSQAGRARSRKTSTTCERRAALERRRLSEGLGEVVVIWICLDFCCDSVDEQETLGAFTLGESFCRDLQGGSPPMLWCSIIDINMI